MIRGLVEEGVATIPVDRHVLLVAEDGETVEIVHEVGYRQGRNRHRRQVGIAVARTGLGRIDGNTRSEDRCKAR